jgi:hypothetical protein
MNTPATIAIPPVTPAQHAAIHHAMVLLIANSEVRIKQLEDTGSGKTESAENWRRLLVVAHEVLEAIGMPVKATAPAGLH